MAGERKGKTYEALVHTALTLLQRSGNITSYIFWNQKPRTMSIEPDFTLGPDKDNPDTCILVTQSGSAKESEKKNWRNIGELVELKTVLKTQPSVLSIMFDSIAKEDLKKVQAAAFDGQLIVGDLDYGAPLQKWIDDHLADLPTYYASKAKRILELYDAGHDPDLGGLLDRLCIDISALLDSSNQVVESLWTMVAARTQFIVPSPRTSHVRRGAAKCLVLGTEFVPTLISLYKGELVRVSELPSLAVTMGVADIFEGILRPNDDEVKSFLECIRYRASEVELILANSPPEMCRWIHSIRELPSLKKFTNFVIDNFDSVVEPDALCNMLLKLHEDPSSLLTREDLEEIGAPRMVWLYEVLMLILKDATGSRTGFGTAPLARAASRIPGMPPANDRLYKIVIPDWISRSGRESLPRESVHGLATVLATMLKSIGRSEVTRLCDTLSDSYLKLLFEDKIIGYWKFQPLGTLVKAKLASADEVTIRSCFAEASGAWEQAGVTRIVRSASTLIGWKTAHGSHTSDKKKELCGRAVALRYTWDNVNKTFKPRPGVSKLILVLDGTWRQGDLDALLRAGWDEIYYADEMSKLAKAVV